MRSLSNTMDALRRMRLKLKYGARSLLAAEQMWSYVKQGVAFEIPLALSTDDATTKALLCLQEMHPEVPVSMLQSRGIVVGQTKAAQGVSPEAWALLDKASYFPEAKKAANAEAFLSQHEMFIRRNFRGLQGGVDDRSIEGEIEIAQRKQAERDAIVLGAVGIEQGASTTVMPVSAQSDAPTVGANLP